MRGEKAVACGQRAAAERGALKETAGERVMRCSKVDKRGSNGSTIRLLLRTTGVAVAGGPLRSGGSGRRVTRGASSGGAEAAHRRHRVFGGAVTRRKVFWSPLREPCGGDLAHRRLRCWHRKVQR